MTKIKENTYYFVAFITAIIALGLSLLSLPLIYINYGSVSFGIFVGGFIGALSFFILGLLSKNEKDKPSLWPTIIVIICKLIVIAAVTIITAFLYYKKEMHFIHPIAVLGSYLISSIVLVISNLFKKGE